MQRRTILIFVGILLSTLLSATILLRTPISHAENSVFMLGANERISVGTDGLEANNESYHPFASADGRFVAFISFADNFVPEADGVTKCLENFICTDVFLRDRVADTTIRLSNSLDGNQGNNTSFEPYVSNDGQRILFSSVADNLVPGDTNDDSDFYGSDGFIWEPGQPLVRITTKANGDQIKGNSSGFLSGDGKTVYFQSNGQEIMPALYPEVVEVYKRDMTTGVITHVPVTYDGSLINGDIINLQTDDIGRYIVFTALATNIIPNDINGKEDIYIFDTQSGEVKLVSHTPTGFVGNDHSAAPMLSPDGTFVAFRSSASDLVPNDTNGTSDVFLYNIATEEVTRVSVAADGTQANGYSKDAAVCQGGKFVAFTSEATNLVPNDTNGQRDIFIRHTATGAIEIATSSDNGELGNGKSYKSRFLPGCDGLMYATDSSNIVPNDTNGMRDLFLREITLLPDLSQSQQLVRGSADAGDLLTYTVRIENTGGQSIAFNYSATLPVSVTHVSTSGAVYDDVLKTIAASGVVVAGEMHLITVVVQIDAAIVDPTIITLNGQLSGGSQVINMSASTMVNGLDLFLPAVRR